MKPDYSKLCRHLGYQFKDTELLKRALSHRSIGKKNNERLEFLGDAVLGYVIAESLYRHFPKDNEGKLSRYRSLLVRGETLAEIAKEFELGDYLNLGSGELKSGGFRRASILSDAVEAIIGAITLDADIETAKSCVLNWFNHRIQKVDKKVLKDPKSRLQEYLQSQRLALPVYHVTAIEGKEHNQTFYVECVIECLGKRSTASGSSRRNAEQQAAVNLLEILHVQ